MLLKAAEAAVPGSVAVIDREDGFAKRRTGTGRAAPSVESVGGPDAFGYVYVDSNEPGGPLFSWVDLSSTGTAIPFGDDTTHGPFALGFTFNFYGLDYTEVAASSNGFIEFAASTLSDLSNDCPLPSTNGQENIVAGVWDDLNATTGPAGGGFYQSFAAGACPYGSYAGACFIMQWNTYHHASSPADDVIFEIILFDDDSILIQIFDASNEAGLSSTTGIENVDATIGLNYAPCNAGGSIADNLAILFEVFQGPLISLDKTVGLTADVCAVTDSIVVASGTPVTYCYTVWNLGTVTLTLHDLADSELGPIFTGLPYDLAVGAGVFTTVNDIPITATVTNTGTWTSFNPGPTDVVSAVDTATVVVAVPEPLVCNGPTVTFDAGPAPDWTVINNASGNPVVWTNIVGSGEAGNWATGNGDAASASSDLQGGGSGLYDTELRTPPIDLTGQVSASLTYWANYQNFAAGDFLDLDISTDGGGTWTTLLSWNEDHGSLRVAGGGVQVDVDLTPYVGQSVILRWRYYDPAGPVTSQDWYAQIDDVSLGCVIPVELQSFTFE
jgi:hypothetical protein